MIRLGDVVTVFAAYDVACIGPVLGIRLGGLMLTSSAVDPWKDHGVEVNVNGDWYPASDVGLYAETECFVAFA